jgi:hypothetical protein
LSPKFYKIQFLIENIYRTTLKNPLLENNKVAHFRPPSREIIRGTTRNSLVYEFQ